jgi:NADP-dependent 3-hydroxy acid dehydrogenase YdfG
LSFGAAIVITFAREGAKVTITGRRKETLGEIVDTIATAGGHALAVPDSGHASQFAFPDLFLSHARTFLDG